MLNTTQEKINWKPIVEEESLQKHLRHLLSRIDEELATAAKRMENNSLFTGRSGVLLFQAYYRAWLRSTQQETEEDDLLEQQLMDILAGDGLESKDLHKGLSGVFWVIHHLCQRNYLAVDAGDFLEEADELIYQYAEKALEAGHIDYLNSGLGALFYLCERCIPNQQMQKLLQILEAQFVDVYPDQGYWFNEFSKYTGVQNQHVYFGLSHGLAGMLRLYTMISKRYILSEKYHESYMRCLRYLLASYSEEKDSLYPFLHAYKDGELQLDMRGYEAAWCHGDMGIAMSIYHMAKHRKSTTLKEASLQILEKRKALLEGKKPWHPYPGLCHGSATMVAIYNRMYQYERQPWLREIALAWLEQLLSFYSEERSENAGFDFSTEQERLVKYGYTGAPMEYSLHNGLPGLGLVLLSLLTEVEPDWDRCLLL